MIKTLLSKTTLLTGLVIAFAWGGVVYAQVTTPRAASPASEVSQTIGLSTVIINYSRPSVREREIWGTLVPYGYSATGTPWRSGANDNTVITFSHDAKVEGKEIPAGTYGLFTAVHEDGKADIIFSKNSTSWGSFSYVESEDQLRVTIDTEAAAHTEILTYHFLSVDKNSTITALDWEQKRIPFKVEFDVDQIVLANAENELRSTAGFNWRGPASAAQYTLQNEVELEKGLVWAEQSIGNQKNFNNLSLKSQLQAKLGQEDEAKATIEEALNEPSAAAGNYYQYGRQLIGQDKDDEAMEIFTSLSKKWPDHWLAPHGLARGYSAQGNYKKALKYEQEALAKCPQGSKQFLEGYVKKLEASEDFN